MFAVFNSCGKQHKASPGDVIYLDATVGEVGKTTEFSEVLLFAGKETLIGRPLLLGASVKAQVAKQMKGPKVDILKMRRRKNSRKRMGFRQDFTRLVITEVNSGNGQVETLDKTKLTKILETLKKPVTEKE